MNKSKEEKMREDREKHRELCGKAEEEDETIHISNPWGDRSYNYKVQSR